MVRTVSLYPGANADMQMHQSLRDLALPAQHPKGVVLAPARTIAIAIIGVISVHAVVPTLLAVALDILALRGDHMAVMESVALRLAALVHHVAMRPTMMRPRMFLSGPSRPK